MGADETGRLDERLALACFEHGRLEMGEGRVRFSGDDGCTILPTAALAAVALGPGATATTAAVAALAASGCTVCWTGADGTRLLAGLATGQSGRRLAWQACSHARPRRRHRVARRLFEKRLGASFSPRTTIEAMRGEEGRWMKSVYADWARRTGVAWSGRQAGPAADDAVNKALNITNGCLYGICHSAILAAGCSAGLGFVHQGDARSFVYDIADLYKHETSIPAAFEVAAAGEAKLGPRARTRFVERVHEAHLLRRLIPDIKEVLGDPDTDEEGA